MTSDTYPASPPHFGRIASLHGFLPLSEEHSPLATHGSGILTTLLRSRSTASLHKLSTRRPSSLIGRDVPDDEESGSHGRYDNEDYYRQNEERRQKEVLNGPQMRSMRLIGHSNPRYRWAQYWKTEEELKKMKKPM